MHLLSDSTSVGGNVHVHDFEANFLNRKLADVHCQVLSINGATWRLTTNRSSPYCRALLVHTWCNTNIDISIIS